MGHRFVRSVIHNAAKNMVISNYSLQIVEENFQDRFNRSLQEKFQKLFPGFYDGDFGFQKIKLKRLECQSLHIYTEKGIFLLLCVEPMFGPDFCQSKEWKEFFRQCKGQGDDAVQTFFECSKSN